VPHPVKVGIALASTDCVALDSIASEIMGISYQEVPYIVGAARRGLGMADIDKINVVGEKVEKVRRKFRRNT
jgi:uncharacterized protein (DUF362 family)